MQNKDRITHEGKNEMNNYQKLTENEMLSEKKRLKFWLIVRDDKYTKLSREFSFPNFKTALDFAYKIGALAEEEDHHPTIFLSWGKTKVNWWTHEVNGLTKLDFQVARRCNEIYEKSYKSEANEQ